MSAALHQAEYVRWRDEVARMTDAEILARCNCYCKPGATSCGACQVCGEPGHMAHYPGPLPFTGCWCDEHYILELREQGMMKGNPR